MNIKEFRERLIQARANIINNREKELLTIASDVLAQVKLRIQTSGINKEGSKFPEYTNPYKKARKAYGAQTEYVDFTVTGRLWANVIPTTQSRSETNSVVRVAAQSDDNQVKIDGAFKKRGNILEPSDQELQLAIDLNRERVLKELSFLR